jgi:tetratricopeptide (TPR) repeat protein
MDEGADAMDRAAFHARKAGLPLSLTGWRAMFRFLGTQPYPDVVAWLDEQAALGARDSVWRARAVAAMGRFDEAREALADSLGRLEEQGSRMRLAGVLSQDAVEVELRAGNAARAVELGEKGCRMLDEAGERGMLSTSAGMLANAYCELGDFARAEDWAKRSQEIGTADDVVTQILWRRALAKVLARRGEHRQAEDIAAEAVDISRSTQMLDIQADALLDQAEILERAGKDPRATLEVALERYEQRGNSVMAARARKRLDSLLQLEE